MTARGPRDSVVAVVNLRDGNLDDYVIGFPRPGTGWPRRALPEDNHAEHSVLGDALVLCGADDEPLFITASLIGRIEDGECRG